MTIEHTMKVQNLMRLIQPEGWMLKEARELDDGRIVVTLVLAETQPETASPHEGEGK